MVGDRPCSPELPDSVERRDPKARPQILVGAVELAAIHAQIRACVLGIPSANFPRLETAYRAVAVGVARFEHDSAEKNRVANAAERPPLRLGEDLVVPLAAKPPVDGEHVLGNEAARLVGGAGELDVLFQEFAIDLIVSYHHVGPVLSPLTQRRDGFAGRRDFIWFDLVVVGRVVAGSGKEGRNRNGEREREG